MICMFWSSEASNLSNVLEDWSNNGSRPDEERINNQGSMIRDEG
jgi:hypothetical protein